MAFTQKTLAKTSSGYSHIISGQNWTYTSTTDTLATILVDGYFDTIVALVQVGEVFQVKDSTNEVELIEVSAINPTAPRVETKSFVGGGSIPDGSVTLPKLATGISPSHVVKFSEIRTTVGGSAAENFTFTGALVSDLVHAQLIVQGTATVTIFVASMLSDDTVSVLFSANPTNDAILLITILRAAV